ncbi:MAG: MraY family glycosyltransferase, partial [Xanthomonadales bacterium]|nr:MraY family glycosyltransferase [Xanthomonadales bacterium]
MPLLGSFWEIAIHGRLVETECCQDVSWNLGGIMGIFVAALIALLSTVFLVRLFAPVAVSMGHVDEPGGRKTHRVPIPLIGGLCMLIGAQLGILAVPTPLGEYRGLFAGAILMLVTGFLDDVRELPARARFIAEIGTVLIAIALGGPVLHDFGNLLGNFQTPLGWFAIPVTVFCVVGVINALNMIDGADGLAGTMFLVCAGTMLILAGMAGAVSAVGVLAVVFGAVLGFLLLNARWRQDSRAQVFMGDAGSL